MAVPGSGSLSLAAIAAEKLENDYTDVDTALAPYRYFELIVSAIIAYIVFNEIPTDETLWGALIIIPSTLFIIYSEKKELSK